MRGESRLIKHIKFVAVERSEIFSSITPAPVTYLATFEDPVAVKYAQGDGGSNGRPELKSAGKKSACKRCHNEIGMGEKCCDVPNLRSTFTSAKRFCIPCYLEILSKTKEDILNLEEQLLS